MKCEWQAVPTHDTTIDPILNMQYTLRICGMTLLGLSIGCAFVAFRWIMGIDV